jgi:hypothetical protein
MYVAVAAHHLSKEEYAWFFLWTAYSFALCFCIDEN